MPKRLPFVLLGAVLVLSLVNDRYFWGHLWNRPSAFDGAALRSVLLDQFLPLALVLLGGLGASSLGRTILGRVGLDEARCPGAPLALGAGALGLLVFWAALAHAPVLLAAAAWSAAVAFTLARERRAGAAFAAPPRWALPLVVILAYAAFHLWAYASAPPTSFDTVSYHLAIPKLYQRAGGIVELPWLLHSRWPHLMETLYLLPLSLGCDRAAALIHLLLCGGLIAAVFRFGKAELGEGAAWTAAALLAAQPVLAYVAPEPHSDGALALFHFSAAAALWGWGREGSRGLLLAAGFLSGLGAASKVTGVVPTATLAAMTAVLARKERARAAASFLAAAAIPYLPWAAKTWIETGNPLWPLFSGLFGGEGEPARLVAAIREFSGWDFPKDAPLLARYAPHRLLLPLALLGTLAWPGAGVPSSLRFLLASGVPLALVAAGSREAWRFMLPLLPALALLAGWWTQRLVGRGGWRKGAALLVVAAALAPTLALSQGNALYHAAGLRSSADPNAPPRESYLLRAADYYAFFRRLPEWVGAGDRVLLFRESRGYYLDVEYRWAEPELLLELEASGASGPDDLIRRLRERGVTHVLLHNRREWGNSFTPLRVPVADLIARTLAERATMAAQEGAYALYRLDSADSGPQARANFVK